MKKFFLLIIAFLVLCSCKPRLVILHLNDTHSHYEAIRDSRFPSWGGVIERAAYIDSVRKAEGEDKVLLVHAGDFSQGPVYFSALNGFMEPKIINALAYDCVTLGNHEFDNGLSNLCERIKLLTSTKVVCSNIDFSAFELANYVKPYVIIEKAGLKLGFLGLAPDLQKLVFSQVSQALVYLDNVEAVNKYSSILKEEEQCDLVIILSHIGIYRDLELVPQIHNVDCVVGGHTHTAIEKPMFVKDADGKKVPVVQSYEWGKQIGMIKYY